MNERKAASGEVREARKPAPSNTAVALALMAAYPKVFQEKASTAWVVNAVVKEMGRILVEEGHLILREVVSLHVVKGEKKVFRTRVVARTSWVMFDRLNPERPKVRNRKKRVA